MVISISSPFPVASLPRVWSWIQDFRWRVCDDFAPATLPAFMESWSEERPSWGIYRDGELGGLVTFERVSPIVGTTHCLFAKRFWGHETTLPALRAVYREIFEQHPDLEKLSSLAFEDNMQLKGMAKLLGGSVEGVLRNHTRRQGKLVNMVTIGLLRSDFMKPAAVLEMKQEQTLQAA